MFVHRTSLSAYDAHLIGIDAAKQVHDKDSFLDIENIEDEIIRAANVVYNSLGIAYDREVYPWEKICEEAANEMLSELHPSIKAEVKQYSGDEELQEDDHFFLVVKYKGKKWLVDPTYLQFVDLEERVNAPSPVMIIPLSRSINELKAYLSSWGLNEDDHNIWVSTIFKTKD